MQRQEQFRYRLVEECCEVKILTLAKAKSRPFQTRPSRARARHDTPEQRKGWRGKLHRQSEEVCG